MFVKSRTLPSTEIRLLRQELEAKDTLYFEGIDAIWQPAQPRQELTPDHAAKILGVKIWDSPSDISARYKFLQQRFPPDQFVSKHAALRPAFELLGQPISRLNWFWKSGLMPVFPDVTILENLQRKNNVNNEAITFLPEFPINPCYVLRLWIDEAEC